MAVIKTQTDKPEGRFGTFSGVFTPTTLTILGAVMYLRTGWVVGNAGLLGAIGIILLSNVITITTGLSIASVATNIRVRAGGAFSIISQSLGLEVGGSVSVPFYMAQSISVAFYIFAFTEGVQRVAPEAPELLIVFGSFTAAFIIAFASANFAARTQGIILVIIFISLFVVFLGSFGVGEAEGFVTDSQLIGDYRSGGFWQIFAVFFPAVTGILAGVNMSGDLKDPRRSIPIGTMSAIVLTMVIYIMLTYWFSRIASPEALVENLTIIVDRSAFGPAILAGILAATFSSALTSMVGAPRILQALAQQNIVPGSESLAKQSGGEPRNAMFVTAGIAIAALLFGLSGGGLNTIAPLMTLFFLITYAVLNAVVLLEQTLGLVSFRPLFTVPRMVPFVGLAGCIVVMFLINAIFSLFAIIVILGLYAFLTRRQLAAPWSDVRSGLFVTVAEWAAKRVRRMPSSQERAWKPNLLVPVKSTDNMLGSYRFVKFLAYPRGSVHILGIYAPGENDSVKGLHNLARAFTSDEIFSLLATVEADDYWNGTRMGIDVLQSAFSRPNALFLEINQASDLGQIQTTLKHLQLHRMGAILFYPHPEVGLGRETSINIWIREQSPDWEIALRMTNLDLALLLAYQIMRDWNGIMRLITVIEDEDEKQNAQQFLNDLIELGRMPRGTQAIVHAGSFQEFVSKGPRADLNIFGLQEEIQSLDFMLSMPEQTRSSCLYVQDSGLESALA
jgi:solute carrier family 12 sodium/potassium/chloride transporter 2